MKLNVIRIINQHRKQARLEERMKRLRQYIYLVDSACSSIICSHGSKCLIDGNGLPRCYCPDNCNEYNDRISSEERLCGSDNQTYETMCELNKRACQTQQNLTVVYQGSCRMLIFSLLKKKLLHLDLLENCPYGNCAKPFDQCNPSIECSSDEQRLCASNLQEYFNECEMNKYGCQAQIYLTKVHDGPCDYHEQQQQLEGK